MKYTGVSGITKIYKHTPMLSRSINIGVSNPGTWVEDRMLEVIWRSAHVVCEEVKLNHVYRDTNTVIMWRNYELVFIPVGHPSRRQMNEFVWKIERALIKEIGVQIKASHETGI